MPKFVELKYPLSGLSESMGRSMQPPGTTRDEENMRSINCVDGAIQGAQRAGTLLHVTGFAKAQGTKIQHIMSDTYEADVINYTQVTNLDFDNGAADAELIEWDEIGPTNEDALDVATDRQGNVFLLESGGVVTKYNEAGERQQRLAAALSKFEVVVNRIEVSHLGTVLIAGSHTSLNIGTLYAFRLRDKEDKFYDLAWKQAFEGNPKDLRIDGGRALVLIDMLEESENAAQHGRIMVVSGIDTATPFFEAEFPVPSKSNAIDVGISGGIYVTAEADEARGTTPVDFTAVTTSWSPHELSTSQARIYFWTDATALTNIVDGATVQTWPYRLTFAADNGKTGFTAIADTTSRPFLNRDGLGDQRDRYAPRYDGGGFGTQPGVRFNAEAETPGLRIEVETPANRAQDHLFFDSFEDIGFRKQLGFAPATAGAPFFGTNAGNNIDRGIIRVVWDYRPDLLNFLDFPITVKGQGLTTYANKERLQVEAAGDEQPTAKAMFPQANDSIFITAMMIRFKSSDKPQVVFQHQGVNFKMALVANIDGVTGAGADYIVNKLDTDKPVHVATPGAATLFWSTGVDTASATNRVTFRFDTRLDDVGDTTATEDNVNSAGVLTIIQNANDPTNGSLFVRWNGQLVGRLAGAASVNDPGGSLTAFSSLGGYVKPYHSTLDVLSAGLGSFDGWIGEVITLLPTGSTFGDEWDHLEENPGFAPDTAGTNDTDCIVELDMTGGAVVQRDWLDLEGYFAHKYGTSHSLPHGFTNEFEHNSKFYENSHPYGGVGNPITGSIGTDVDANVLALRSTNGILAKYGGNFGDLKWAYAGEGVGYGVVADSDGDVMCIGDYTNGVPVGSPSKAVTAKKFLDFGNTVQRNIRQPGILDFSAGQPSDLETFSVQLDSTGAGDRTDTWTYVTPGPPADNTEIEIGGSIATTIQNTVVQMNAFYNSGPGGNLWENTIILEADTSAETMTILVNLAAYVAPVNILTEALTNVIRIDFTGGVRVPDAWEYWTVSTDSPTRGDIRIRTDTEGDLYFPLSAGLRLCQARKLAGTSTDGQTTSIWDFCLAELGTVDRFQANGIAFAPDPPPYDGVSPATGPEVMYVATDTTRSTADGSSNQEGLANTLHKVTLVSSVKSSTNSPRAVQNTVISGGDMYPWTGTYGTVIEAGVFSATAQEVQSVALFSKRYITDGITFKVYDPKANTLEDFTATGHGKIPKRVALLAAWRGRLVVVSYDDRHNWAMSRQGDPEDWDEFPPEGLTFENPISGNHPDSIGKFPDIINAMVPYDDQVMIALCDHQVYRMVGDPMSVPLAGHGGMQRSYIGLVSDITGGAFGQQCWAKDPEGNLYFLGSKGGVWKMDRGFQLARISYGAVERLVSDFDFDTYRLALAWSREDEGLHLFQLPVGAGGTLVRAYFWEQKTNSWHPDSWSDAAQQPTAVTIIDGDLAGDRKLVIGTEDGQILRWDRAAYTDNLTRLASHVVMGPYALGKPGHDYALISLTTELANAGGVEVQVFVGQDSILPDTPVWEGPLEPGRNPALLLSAAGEYVWIRYSNASMANNETSRWAHEKTVIEVHEMGYSRSMR